jgi:hypothetical protein
MSTLQNEQPNMSLVPKKDSKGVPIPGTCDGTMVRIRLYDDRERVLFFKDNPSPNSKQVARMVAEKLNLAEASIPFFSVWIVGHDLELQIRARMEMTDMIAKWPRYVEKYTHNSFMAEAKVSTPPFKFVFKREAMVTKEQEQQIKDETAIKLLFGEAKNNYISGRYPVEKTEDAALLAGIQLQISYGDYNPQKHGPTTGFVSQSLAAVLSKKMISKMKQQEWENKICSLWSQSHGKSGIPIYNTFLDYFRKQSYYGSTFFAAWYIIIGLILVKTFHPKDILN